MTTTYNYTYDDRGNITEIRDAGGVIQYRYHYDDLGQLTREDNRAKNQTYIYTYDNAGNITSKKTHALSMGAILGAEVSTVAYTYGNASWGDLLTKYGSTSIRYDTIGNPTRIGSTDLFWRGRELMSWEDDYYRTTYTYNADGIRTSKEEYEFGEDYVERTEYMLNGSQIIGETVYFSQDAGVTFTEQYTLIYLYDESSMPIGMMYRTPSYSDYAFDYYFFEKNLQGDIVAIYNASGTKIGSYTYDAWGKCTATSNTSGYNTILYANPFRYRGYYYDSETGYYYLQSRYYNPTWGRFLNADCVISGVGGSIHGYNMFVYCFNNPINMVDSKGDWPEWIEAIGDWINDNIIEPAAECVAQFLVDVIEDAINFDSNNTDAEKVFESNYFSMYNGTLVIRHSSGFLTSWSINDTIFLNHDLDSLNSNDRANELNHEYGHILQERELGTEKYLLVVALPSVVYNLGSRVSDTLDNNYHNMPWEYDADMRVGVSRPQHASWAGKIAIWYMEALRDE